MDFIKKNKEYVIVISTLILIIIVCTVGLLIYTKKYNKTNNTEQPQYNFTIPTEETKQKYEITCEKELENGITKITGTVKSNNQTENTIQIVAKVYKADGKLAIVSQTVLEKVKNNETRNFEISLNGNYMYNTYILEVEYIEE
jgi:CRISPR/Cas system-associated protein Cas7 (RAMP superfamily)